MSGLRAPGCTLVASITVSRPAASRLAAMKFSTSKASAVADWSLLSSLTSPRQKSDEMTSVLAKCRAATVAFPDPVTPTRTTSDRAGTLSTVIAGTPRAETGSRPRRRPGPCPRARCRRVPPGSRGGGGGVRRARAPARAAVRGGALGPEAGEFHLVAVAGRDSFGPVGELPAGPLETVVAVAQGAGRQPVQQHVVLGVRRGHDHRGGPGVPEDISLERRDPGRVQVLDDLDHRGGVEPA